VAWVDPERADRASEPRPVEIELEHAGEPGADRYCAYLLLDDQGEVAGAAALRSQRHIRVPPTALLIALTRAMAEDPVTQISSAQPVTKRTTRSA
jgi:hypothetical protein